MRAFPSIPLVEVESWNQFQAYYDEHFGTEWGRWIFRGQACSDWKLVTRLERELGNIPVKAHGPEPNPIGIGGYPVSNLRERLELFFFKAFRSRANLLLQRESLPTDTLTLLSLMQHWGYPTRLLDFTTSPYVALHFALAPIFRNSRVGKAALFAVHQIPLQSLSSARALKHTGILTRHRWDSTKDIDFNNPEQFNDLFFGSDRPLIVTPVHPSTVNERIVAQQGTFLCPSKINGPLELILFSLVSDLGFNGLPADINQIVRKLTFSPAAVADIFPRLVRMNIHEASLFPDLSGHARYVTDAVQIFRSIKDGKWLIALEGMEKLNWLG